MTLFVYGTLLFDPVLEALLGRIPQRLPAAAPGWRVAAMEGRVYPGLVAAPGTEAPGVLLTDLGRREWAIIARYEEEGFALREITLSSGRRALTHVWLGTRVREENWDPQVFECYHLPGFVAWCASVAPELTAEADRHKHCHP
ncbi:gamma-glutamylcyclotransferase family protein [Streptomyces sp. N35]|uniref:gamma-glutamylcyclotransferase family protein n=1 Tax=Streptomyces sp. N35 TaxID=2795730 RepID=UPI0018F3C000|nr:gamma-glutamylcyclotransferase family protein [Streptomyces sp. N35]